MTPVRLASARNPVAQRVRRAAQGRGRKEGCILLEGRHILEEALGAGWPLEVFLVAPDLWPRWSLRAGSLPGGPAVYLADRDLQRRLGTVPSPEGLLALAVRRDADLPSPRPGDLFLYLDKVQDPVNVGMLVRSALAFGLAGVLLGAGTADAFHPTAMARSAGASLRLAPVPCPAERFLAWAGRHGARILGAEAGGVLSGLPEKRETRVLALGNEGGGLSPEIRAACSGFLSIPMSAGWDSLNVAVAGSLLMRDLAAAG